MEQRAPLYRANGERCFPKRFSMATISNAEEKASALLFDKLVWSVEDVARVLHVTSRHVYKLVSNDDIPYAKVGRLVRFSPVRIYEWLNKGGTR